MFEVFLLSQIFLNLYLFWIFFPCQRTSKKDVLFIPLFFHPSTFVWCCSGETLSISVFESSYKSVFNWRLNEHCTSLNSYEFGCCCFYHWRCCCSCCCYCGQFFSILEILPFVTAATVSSAPPRNCPLTNTRGTCRKKNKQNINN